MPSASIGNVEKKLTKIFNKAGTLKCVDEREKDKTHRVFKKKNKFYYRSKVIAIGTFSTVQAIAYYSKVFPSNFSTISSSNRAP